jgi:hypothetical protein
MDFEDTRPKIFGKLFHWLYFQEFPKAQPSADMVDMWILEDGMLIPKLKNDVMRVMCGYSENWFPDPKNLLAAYAKTSAGSALQRFLVRAFAVRTPSNEFQAMADGLH